MGLVYIPTWMVVKCRDIYNTWMLYGCAEALKPNKTTKHIDTTTVKIFKIIWIWNIFIHNSTLYKPCACILQLKQEMCSLQTRTACTGNYSNLYHAPVQVLVHINANIQYIYITAESIPSCCIRHPNAFNKSPRMAWTWYSLRMKL